MYAASVHCRALVIRTTIDLSATTRAFHPCWECAARRSVSERKSKMKTLEKVSDFAGKYMAIIALAVAIIALIIPGPVHSALPTSWVNTLLGIVMFGMGMTLKLSDFKVVFTKPKAVIVGICSQFIVKCPADFVPDGWNPPAAKSGATGAADKNWKEMLATPIFYVMIVMLFLGAVFGMMAISQASNIAQSMVGMTPAAAAIVVSVLALFNTFGRILCGYISDRIGRINTLTGVLCLAIAALGMLYFSEGSVVLFYIGICMIGVCFGAFMGVYPGFTAGQFGSRNSSINYAIMFIGFSAAGIAGPMIVSKMLAATGSYRPAFLLAIVMAVCGLVLSFVYRAMAKKNA